MSEESCIVCYEQNKINKIYFNCSKYHNLCRKCFYTHVKSNNIDKYKCPLCRAELANECKSPKSLTPMEIQGLDKKHILQSNIFIHQNYVLDKNFIPVTLSYNDKKIVLYMNNGILVQHHDMFISEDGFFYEYSDKIQSYILAISKNRYQFWDSSRVYIE